MILNPIVDIHNLYIKQGDKEILNNVSFKINSGDFIYLVGKVGSGKTSLLKALYSDIDIDKGKGKVVGFDICNLKISDIPYLRRKLGIVFQDFQLLPDRNIHNNLLFVLEATAWKNKIEKQKKIRQVLIEVGLEDKEKSMPSELSGGELQRIVIARALLNKPNIILADEPSGNLDPDSSEQILKLLKQISKNNKAILMATHDYSQIKKYANRILKIENKKVFEIPIEDW